ncbi:unnamed protein product [Toxocara canis]|uniref:Uncharacterized protein n=1 Tax=Toxocara canis TaxID=6265 RepID=A0A183VB58_TOXCA|nr:unnamed protein product [Toxocara canis]
MHIRMFRRWRVSPEVQYIGKRTAIKNNQKNSGAGLHSAIPENSQHCSEGTMCSYGVKIGACCVREVLSAMNSASPQLVEKMAFQIVQPPLRFEHTRPKHRD